MDRLILATVHGIVFCEQDGDSWNESGRGLEDQYVTSAIARAGVILAGTKNGVFRSEDEGRTWQAAAV